MHAAARLLRLCGRGQTCVVVPRLVPECRRSAAWARWHSHAPHAAAAHAAHSSSRSSAGMRRPDRVRQLPKRLPTLCGKAGPSPCIPWHEQCPPLLHAWYSRRRTLRCLQWVWHQPSGAAAAAPAAHARPVLLLLCRIVWAWLMAGAWAGSAGAPAATAGLVLAPLLAGTSAGAAATGGASLAPAAAAAP